MYVNGVYMQVEDHLLPNDLCKSTEMITLFESRVVNTGAKE